jgi:hypothetical protein
LTDLEARRLEELVATNLEARLMHLMLPEFERYGRVQRGDDALAVRIAERALARTTRVSMIRLHKRSWLLAAAILTGVTAATGAWWSVRPKLRDPVVEPSSSAPSLPPKGQPNRSTHPRPAPEPNAPDNSLEAIPPDDVVEETPTQAQANHGPLPSRRTPDARPTAAELFSEANRLRRERRHGEALQLYRTIVDRYANSREAPLARLALAKSLSVSNPQVALRHYQFLAQSDKQLRAEALWGIAESAAVTGQQALRQQALADLLREFPESPYAAVARQGSGNATK